MILLTNILLFIALVLQIRTNLVFKKATETHFGFDLPEEVDRSLDMEE